LLAAFAASSGGQDSPEGWQGLPTVGHGGTGRVRLKPASETGAQNLSIPCQCPCPKCELATTNDSYCTVSVTGTEFPVVLSVAVTMMLL